MKILIVGNSQMACLKKAHDAEPEVLCQHGDIYFYVTPGGTGPYFTIEDDLLQVRKGAINPKFPPRAYPEETSRIPISSYDLIIVSALGYIDGGFSYPSPITRQGLIYEYEPKDNTITSRFLSKTCYQQVICSSLLSQSGFQFLLELRKYFSKKIIVQPFPLLSSLIQNHPEWPLNQMYNNPLAAHRFFSTTRDDFMSRLCKELSVELLPYPCEEWHLNFFTPADFMVASDGLHPYDRYGKMVISDISEYISDDVLSIT